MEYAVVVYNNKIYVYGKNMDEQLELSNIKDIEHQSLTDNATTIQVACNPDNTFILKDNNDVLIFSHRNDMLRVNLDAHCYSVSKLMKQHNEIIQIACGLTHIIMLTIEGNVLMGGCNNFGQLGFDYGRTYPIPKFLARNEKICQIACGYFFTILVTVNGNLLTFGDNSYGQIGLDPKLSKYIAYPQLIMRNQEIRQVVCGCDHTIVLKINGDVLTFGSNNFGQIGGKSTNRHIPELLMHDESIRQIACGSDHTIILNENNDVVALGCNNSGQLGSNHSGHLRNPTLIMHSEEISQITCGSNSTIILKANNDILFFGDLLLVNSNSNDLSNAKATQLMNVPVQFKWTPEKHFLFPLQIRQRIKTFLLVHMHIKINTRIFIPKFIRFEIIKWCI